MHADGTRSKPTVAPSGQAFSAGYPARSGSMRVTVVPWNAVTQRSPNASFTMSAPRPALYVPVTLFVAGSMRETVLSPWFGTHTEPSGAVAPTTGCRPTG